MKRLIWVILAAAGLRAFGFLPFESLEIADLIPVQTLLVSMEGEQVVLDAGECTGQGMTWVEALEDLRHGAPGTVFLGTADQVVVTREAAALLSQMVDSGDLRPGAAVCVCYGTPPKVEELTEYLSAHDGGVTLRQVQAALLTGSGIALPVVTKTQGGLRLYGSANQ